jgi:phosphopantetheinyl transferase
MSNFDTIGMMATHQVTEPGHLDLLSAKEYQRYQSIRHPQRRKRWISGRLAAKYLFLTRWGCDQENAMRQSPRVRQLDAASLGEFPSWAYREVEILPQRWWEAGTPRLIWMGRPHPTHVSLAYTAQLTAACLDPFRAVGLDLEVPCLRQPAFYRMNFTLAEQGWAERVYASVRIGVDRIYTVLWCLKEAALKSDESDEASLWQLPQIEVRLRCPVDWLSQALRPDHPLGSLWLTEVEVRNGGRVRTAEAALAVPYDAILAVLRF